MNSEARFSTITNKLALLAEVCNCCLSLDGAALDGMAAVLQDTIIEIEMVRVKHYGND